MLFGPCVTPDTKHLKTIQQQTVSELTQLVSTYPTRNDIVDIGGQEHASSRLAVRRTQPNIAVTDIAIAVDLTKPDTRQQIRTFVTTSISPSDINCIGKAAKLLIQSQPTVGMQHFSQVRPMN
jgi:hypothetical protein